MRFTPAFVLTAAFGWGASGVVSTAVAQGAAAPLAVERELFQVGGPSHCLEFSPDGARLASGGDRGDIVVHAVETGAVERVLEASDHWVGALRFSPDGGRLLAVGRSVTLWDLTSGDKLAEFPSASAQALDWSADGKWLAMVSNNNEAVVRSAADFTVVHSLALPGPSAADAIAFDADGGKVAVGKRSGETRVFGVASGALLETIAQPDWVHGLAWLDDGRLLRLGWKGTLRGFGDEELAVGKYGYSLHAQGDGSRVLVRASDALLWLAPDRDPVPLDAQGPIALHPDGRHWASADGGRIVLHDGRDPVRSFAGMHRQAPGDAVLTGDGRYAVVVGVKWAEGTTQVFDVTTGERLPVVGFPTQGQLISNPQGVEVVVHAAAAADPEQRELQFWAFDVGTPARARLVRTLPFAMDVRTANPDCPEPWLSADLRYLGHADQLIDLVDGERSWQPDRILFNETLAAGPDHVVSRMSMHSHIAGARGSGTVHVFARDGAEVASKRFESAPNDLSLSPDGARVAVTLRDSVEVFALPDLEPVQSLPWSWRDVVWIDGHTVLGTGYGDQLHLADLRAEKILATLALGSWVRRIDYNRARGIALVTVQDRALIVRVRAGEGR